LNTLYYLAGPFSSPDPEIRESRYRSINRIAADLMAQGRMVFSPISHSFAIWLAGNGHFAHDADVWYRHGMLMARRCDECLVVCLPGWRESKGVQMEIDYFRRANKPLDFLVVA
jgi:hypothetical protein